MKDILIICGPTATGKTNLAVTLAKLYDGELVSADSRQVYRGMDIGTGKDLPGKLIVHDPGLAVNSKNMKYHLFAYDLYGIPIWMYDVVHPDNDFSVSHYRALATAAIRSIQSRNKLPIIVGGTGLFIKSLISDLQTIHIPQNSSLRKELNSQSKESLQEILQKVDPTIWSELSRSDKENSRRLIRKIEIAKYLNQNRAVFSKTDQPYNSLQIGLTASFPYLYAQIDKRVLIRVNQGIESEIAGLLRSGYSWSMPSLQTFGYKEWRQWYSDPGVRNDTYRQSIIRQWQFDEHAYARRQVTWFKKQKHIQWFSIEKPDWDQDVQAIIRSWYTRSTV